MLSRTIITAVAFFIVGVIAAPSAPFWLKGVAYFVVVVFFGLGLMLIYEDKVLDFAAKLKGKKK